MPKRKKSTIGEDIRHLATVGDRIRHLRMAFDYLQNDIAKTVGVSRAAVTQWESGTTVPSEENLVKLTGFFRLVVDVTFDWLAHGKGPAPQVQAAPTTREARRRWQRERRLAAAQPRNTVAVVELYNISSREWHLPVGIVRDVLHADNLFVWHSTLDIDSESGVVKRGDYVFIDQAQTQLHPKALWMVNIDGLGRMLVYSEAKQKSSGGFSICLTTPDGVELRTAPQVVGRLVARFCLF